MPEDYEVDGASFNIFLGHQEQVLELGGIRAMNFGADAEAMQQAIAPLEKALRAAGPLELLGSDPVRQYGFNSPTPANVKEVVKAEHPAFDSAVRVTVKEKPQQVHQVSLSRPNQVPVRKGDVLAVSMYARAVEPHTGATATLFVQGPPDWSKPFVQQTVQLTGEWQQFTTQFVAREDRDVGSMLFNIFLGQQPQVVEFGGIRAFNFGPDAQADECSGLLRTATSKTLKVLS